MVRELLSRGAKIDAATKKGNTALHIASLAGQVSSDGNTVLKVQSDAMVILQLRHVSYA